MRRILLVAALCFSLTVVAAERGERDALPADDGGEWAPSVIVDFPSVASNQTRKSFGVVTNPEQDPCYPLDGCTGAAGCNEGKVCSIAQARCNNSTLLTCKIQHGNAEQPCIACEP